jgi:hypothetical protein
MNKFNRVFKTVIEAYSSIYEANLASAEPIDAAVEQVAKSKGLQDQRIIDWLKKAEKRYFMDNNTDEEKQREGLIRKYEYKEGDEEWKKNAFDVTYNPQRMDFLGHVVDYFQSRDEEYLSKLAKKSYSFVYGQEISAWDAELRRTGTKSSSSGFREGRDYNIIYKLPNGYKIISALTDAVCKYEGDKLGHCAGQYRPGQIWGLWSPENVTHATLEYEGNNIKQIKGYANRAVHPKYWPYLREFIMHLVDDKGYKLLADGENIGLVKWKDKYYDPTLEKYKQLYTKEIKPLQDKRIQEILDSIVTINERYEHVLGYLKLL